MISIYEAAGKGIERLRMERWACRFDHLKITITDKGVGVWVKMYAPFNQECNGRDPVMLDIIQSLNPDERVFVPYTGPLPESEEYRNEALKYKGLLAKK